MINFSIPWDVRGKQGDRSCVRGGRIHHYQPAAVTKEAKQMAMLMRPYRPAVPLQGPIWVKLIFSSPWRKGEPKRNRYTAQPRYTKPDLDNLVKQTLDVLQACGFFENDAQVAQMELSKWWSSSPLLEVSMAELTYGDRR